MADENATKTVLDHHLQAFGEGLEALMGDYTDESVVVAQDGTYRGMNEIRGFFTVFIAGLPEDVWDTFEMKKLEVVGEVGYFHWEAKPYLPLGTDTFLVRDGKILVQTSAFYSASE